MCVAVTSLEAVVLSLQDTCREARNDADDLRHENARLLAAVDGMKQAARDREKQWRDFWHVKQQALGLDDSHLSDLPPPRLPATPPAGTELHTSNRSHYVDEALRFQTNASGDADQRFPASLQPFTTNPEGNWIPGPFSNTRTPCVGDPHPSQSSEASDSPSSISPAVQYNTRFPLNADENRMSLVNLSMPSASYGTCMHVYVPFFFFFFLTYFSDSGPLSVPEYASEGYANRHAISEPDRYSSRPRRAYSGPNPRGGDMYAPDVPRVGSPTQMGHGESEGHGDALHDGTQLRPRRHTSAALMHGGGSGVGGGVGVGEGGHSRSSSPSPRDREREPPMSNTLAVIKAQAFGSLRRTRTRAKKSGDTGSKVAIDILCTRGIGMGVQTAPAPSHQRQHRRKDDLDDVDMNT